MSAQEHSIPYGPGAYRSNALPDLPPSRQQQGGLFETPLRWGHYSGLDSPVEVETQLESEAHKAYEQQLAEGQQPLIFCDAQRWRFENSSMTPYLVFISKTMSFFFAWICLIAPTYLAPDWVVGVALPVTIQGDLAVGLYDAEQRTDAQILLTADAVPAFVFNVRPRGEL